MSVTRERQIGLSIDLWRAVRVLKHNLRTSEIFHLFRERGPAGTLLLRKWNSGGD